MDTNSVKANSKWVVLALAALTHFFAMALPVMCLPVLFQEISEDLGLDLVQVGTIWGVGFLPGIFVGTFAGALSDRFGTKRTLTVFCLLAGIGCMLRGLADGFLTLAGANLLYGFVMAPIPMNVHKACGVWFERRQLGLANGVASTGMALGFMVGSLISATVLSPMLGGWRNVLFLYGVISVVLGLFWRYSPDKDEAVAGAGLGVGVKQALLHVLSVRNIWLLGIAILGFGGCVQGMLGYLPLHLRGMGWPGVLADNALATFHGVSMVAAIPVALLSDRLGSRRTILVAASMMMMVGTGLLSVAEGLAVWIAVIVAGMIRDGFMAVLMTTIIETKGIGATYAGTGIGLVMVFSGLGSVLSPPIGNSLVDIHPGLPFAFWAVLGLMGVISLLLVRKES